MSETIIYHGSPKIIKEPQFGFGKNTNDYGQGFYCTKEIELAKEWACTENTDGYANCYSIDLGKLNVMKLSQKEYSVLNWLAILLENRICRFSSPIEKNGKDYIINNFLPKYSDFDVIIGYRADDSYFSFARAFVSNTISLKQLQYAMRLGKLGEQLVLKSEKAFNALSFVDYFTADNTEYYAKRKERDNNAKEAFFKELETEDADGLYIRDIIRERMTNDEILVR